MMDDRVQSHAAMLAREMFALTGKHYRIRREDLEKMGLEALLKMRQFVRDAQDESAARARKAQMQPWRRP